MPLPTDPLLSQQWHLHNPVAGLLDLNVFGVWSPVEGPAYTGAGTRTVVIDDGFDYLHSDLAPNYNVGLDYDFNDADVDPFGTASDAHGTAVAGIIGAAANGTGAVGVAFGTQLVGYRTHGFINDFWLQNIRDAIHHAAVSAQGDVINISQGIANDTNSEFGFGYNPVRFDEIENSIGDAVNLGRGGLGAIIVKSAGNSRGANYDVNADDWTNDTRQVVVSAVNQDGFVSSYSSYGAALLVSGFGTPGEVVTTDRTGAAGYNSTDFTSGFNGTSAAAPMVSGVVSLMLDANEALGWRDVQSILAATARHVGTDIGGTRSGSERYDWQWTGAKTWNGGGMHFSNDYGYGLVDALAAVRLSESWLLTGASAQRTSNQFTNTMDMLNVATVIPDGNPAGLSFTGNAPFADVVERVTVKMTFSTTFTADMAIYLISPRGTVSELIDNVGGSADYNGTWTFESQAFRGERANGTWTVRVVDQFGGDVLTVSDIVVTTFGDASSNDRYIFTNEYSDYAGVAGHATAVNDTNSGIDTVNAAAVSSASVIRLDGVVGSIDGVAVTFANIENAIGGDGGDTIHGNDVGNMLFGMRGADAIYGADGNDTISGGTGADTLDGGSGTDSLSGGDGNDWLSQSFGGPNETLDGGAGTDTADWSYNEFDVWNINLDTGEARIGETVYAHLVSIENVIGAAQGDTITGSVFNNRLEGRGGNDTIDGGSGTDSLFGGEGDDVLIQSFGGPNELMDGGAGNDTGDWSYSTTDAWTINLTAGHATIGAVRYARLISIENAIGGQKGDYILGSAVANRLEGRGGNDTIDGGRGTDSMYGGDGDDVLIQNFGGPNEVMDGGSGVDTGDWGYSTTDAWTIDLAAGEARIGTMVFAQLTSIENVVGGQLGDSIVGSDVNNRLDGQGGNDTINAGAGADIVMAGAGDDRVIDSDAVTFDMHDGGAGTDWIDYSAVTFFPGAVTIDLEAELVSVIGDTGNTESIINFENVSGSQGGETIIGSWVSNHLMGNGGNDTISGDGGDDTLDGGAGVDSLTGGFGNDTYVVDSASDVIVEVPEQGFDTVLASVSFALASDDHIERLATTDAAATTAINLTGNAVAQVITGNAGDNTLSDGGAGGTDTLVGLGGNDTYRIYNAGARIDEVAGEGNDTVFAAVNYVLAADVHIERLNAISSVATTPLNLTGNALSQTIVGNAGANILSSGAAGGADTLIGLAGNDTYRVFNAGDRIDEFDGQGTDSVFAAVSFMLAADDSIERLGTISASATTAINLTGNSFAQVITGNAGDNLLSGGASGGTDTLAGYAGNDTYRVFNVGDRIDEVAGQGNDSVFAAVSFALAPDDDIERLGALSSAAVTALDLTGNALSQLITGNAGANRIDSRGGNDTVFGFGGADTFVFRDALGPTNVDRVEDFTPGSDIIELENAIFTGLAGGVLAATAFVANAGGAAEDSLDRIIYKIGTGELFFDADGSGAGAAPVLFAVLDPNLAMSSTAFFVV